MPKMNDRIKAMQERAAALAQPPVAPALAEPSKPEDTVAAVSAHFGAALDQIVAQREVQSIPVGHVAPDLRPEMRQSRLLPTPDALIEHGQPVPAYRDLVTELLTLGQSLKEHQIQPIVVYPGQSEQYPSARYLILVGQRRWTAATLVGLPSIDAIVVDPPTLIDRIRIQYAENEEREEFSDMERAWTLLQMKQALHDSAWEDVENRLQISRARRQQLLRLTAFTAAQQEQIARLRLQETQIRTLHTAVRNGDLSLAHSDAILFRVSQIADERAAAQSEQPSPGRRTGIDGPTIARLVARAQRTALPSVAVSAQPTPRWLQPYREQLVRTSQSTQRAAAKIEQLGPSDTSMLVDDLTDLVQQITALLGRVQGDPTK